jgi:serine/threonine-protein kinase
MVGQNIGKYRVTEQIGRGGMGTVYCAVDETLHREVAIKVLNAGLNDPTVARRFRAEAVTIARLNHPGIATIYELVEHDGQWLMVMEYVRGETLERLVSQQGPLSVVRAADLTMQTLAALAHAHGLGVVHRDLKPANLMLGASGSVKIMDFGIARVAGAEQLTSVGFMMGTPAYMAPEQVLGQEIDARTDLYATGLVLFHLVTGTLPFKGDTPIQMAQLRIHGDPTPVRSIRPDLPEWMGQVLEIALAREPGKRFQTSLLFREAIRRGLDNLPVVDNADAGGVPPELVATAAPGTLPVTVIAQKPPIAKPASAAAQTAAQTIAAARVAPTAGAPPAVVTAVAADLSKLGKERAASPRPALSRTTLLAGAGALVLVGALAAWFGLRSPTPVSSAEAVAPTTATAASDADPVPPATDGLAAAPSTAAPSVDSGPAPAAAGATTTTPAPAITSAATSTAPAGPAASPAADAVGTGRAAAVPPATAGRATAAGRGAATPAAPDTRTASFRGLKGFIVSGRRVEEVDAVLIFGEGRVTLANGSGQTSLGALPYEQVRSAVYTNDKNPRWYPTLAGPPADVDMPGGVFRRASHWLSLQSRTGYLIVRMNDADFRQIRATVADYLKIAVDELRPQ